MIYDSSYETAMDAKAIYKCSIAPNTVQKWPYQLAIHTPYAGYRNPMYWIFLGVFGAPGNIITYTAASLTFCWTPGGLIVN